MKNFKYFSCILCFLLFSCSENMQKNQAITYPGFTGKWELEHMPGYSQSVEILYASGLPWFEIDSAKGTFIGNTGCNSISGDIAIPDSMRLYFSNPVVTEKACPGDAEAAFLHALNEVQFYHWQHRDSLWLLRENRVVMRFIRVK